MSKDLINLKKVPKGLFSADLRGKVLTIDTFYKHIINNKEIGENLEYQANYGFYTAGKILCQARDQLKTKEFGKLKKQIASNKRINFSEKNQERFMAIADDEEIQKRFTKMPPQWTFWHKLVQLRNKDEKEGTNNFQRIEHLIAEDTKWRDIEIELGNFKKQASGRRSTANDRDNRQEIFGLEYDFKVATKKHKKDFIQFTNDIKKLASKYKFIKLTQKNYFNDAMNILDEDRSKTKDDTAKVETKSKLKSYNPRKKIEL